MFPALALALLASNAAALSIGNAQGKVVLGRPLNLVFPVASDGRPLADSCVRAEVFAGDTQVSPSQVRLALGTAVAGREAVVRLQTTQVVIEPVLMVRITAGCDGSVVRNFTLLSYPAEAAGAAGSPPVATEPLTLPLRKPLVEPQLPRAGRASATDADETSSPTAASRPKPAARRASEKSSTASADAVRNKRSARPTPSAPVASTALKSEQEQPRLVMEPLSDWLSAPAALRSTPEMAKVPAPEASAERAAAASLWRALNMPADELALALARTSEQTAQLAQAQRDKAAALDVQARLQTQLAQSYSANLVYALCVLLVLLAGFAIWLWSRAKRLAHLEQLAWSQAVANNVEPPMADVTGTSGYVATATHRADDHGAGRLAPTEPELLPSGMIPLEFGMAEPPQAAPQAAPQRLQDAVVPRQVSTKPAPHAVVNPEDLFDLQQQAEFFVSVGEHGQAIQVLRQHIEANQATSPLAYLELLRLYRSLSRFDDYNNLRAQLHLYFNAQVPEFSAFTRQGKNLFGYPDELARIEALWADGSVVALLKEMLFRDSAQEHQRFELAAYDDLLLLQAIASTTLASARGNSTDRTRTTPTEAVLPEAAAFGTAADSVPADANLMDFEPDWDFAPSINNQTPDPDERPSGTVELDLDLSDLALLDEPKQPGGDSGPLPFLTDEALPPSPGTGQPQPDQPIGFGANSDRFEARLDPDVRKPD